MNEIEFEDSSITIQTERNGNPPLIVAKEDNLRKSNYETHRESLNQSKLRSIPSSLGYGSVSDLKSLLFTMSVDQKLKLLLRGVKEAEVLEVTAILESFQNEKPTLIGILDQNQQTLVHIASYKNSPAIVEKLLDYELNQRECVKEQFITWINAKNQDTFTALHFAAFVGSIQTLEILYKNGADLSSRNQQGQNSLAIAAQGDQVMAMVWLQIQGLSYTELDAKGGTPLHWATYYGSEFALQYLLSWICKLENGLKIINQQDMEGMTALHLAAMTGNIRIAKKLLLKGADKNLRDSRGITPAEEAQVGQYENIYQLLENSNCLYEFLNIKQSTKPASTSWGQITAFFILYFFCMLGTIIFIYPLLQSDIWLQVCSISSFVVGLVFYFLTWCMSPGYVTKNKDCQVLFNLLTNFEPWELCPECQIKKPKRSRHCEYCKCCVIVYDHHCPWINNCIGANNHAIFICFIVTILINLFHIFLLNCLKIGQHYTSVDDDNIYTWFNGIQNLQNLYIIKLCICSIIMLICLLFAFPLSYLVYVQFDNLFQNKTTFEKYKQEGTKQKQKDSQLSSSSTSASLKAHKNHSCSNFGAMCCTNKYNKNYLT